MWTGDERPASPIVCSPKDNQKGLKSISLTACIMWVVKIVSALSYGKQVGLKKKQPVVYRDKLPKICKERSPVSKHKVAL